MTPETEPSTFLGQTLAWVAAGISAVGAWLWTNTMGRIQRLEQTKVDQSDFDAAMIRIDRDRTERRDTEIKLFEKLDALKDQIRNLK